MSSPAKRRRNRLARRRAAIQRSNRSWAKGEARETEIVQGVPSNLRLVTREEHARIHRQLTAWGRF